MEGGLTLLSIRKNMLVAKTVLIVMLRRNKVRKETHSKGMSKDSSLRR